ncbi:GntR family transcriptional regulator [Mediterraneibacter glycyrrhizinilyticus]|jgi:GntR family transcriptional regulator of arabinose operon|uniref:GntR family transcriptional regulator n=1 Tax=Candidatus Mediterraneibacter faecipullorum TaxID=2838670 RepID=A0A9D2NKP0_9FIRM|nr:GntR family transcriptional regulator [Mediterraneibacter glycyrrhizinilyticus]MBM6803050.1 GntR family transcriptional regulator [Mediterraneibacter glycyrrhizinilyticus]MDM8126013.1 GntR family transcriptional regulator [Mediterraneibacter glycyrrhizinilyticus]MDM8211984.1 GntR family transcriptional regulator [Mediterraneibacter glycyrrhizinilyticus]HJC34191.1 GntR family transcriptional regulator [Candidatus Mediterraneibacter faecipullorum]
MQKKYERIVSWVQTEIENGALSRGDKLPSENELMERFRVSRQTVRRAMEELTEKGVVEGRRGSGTYVTVNTRRYAAGKEIRIAVMLTYVDTYIFPSIIKGIESVLSSEGCTLQIAMTDNAVEKERMLLKEFIHTQSVDGIIAETVKSALPNPNMELYREIENMGIPVLFVNSYYKELDIPHISMDDRKAGYLAAKHLAECGHTRIGGIFKADDGQGHLRYAGYTDALMEQEIKIRGDQVIWIDSEELRTMGEESAKFLKRLKGCTACVCYNDETAYKIVEIFRKAGHRVPEDLSVVGIDNSGLAKFCPVPLTSVENPVEKLGRTAAERMTWKIFRNEEMETVEFEPQLIMRNSVQVIHQI